MRRDDIRLSIESITKQTNYPSFPFESLSDVRKIESETTQYNGERLIDMYLLFVLPNFEADLFKAIRKKLKHREPKVTIIGVPYLLDLAQDRENKFRYHVGKNIYRNIFNNNCVVVGGHPKLEYEQAIMLAKHLGALVKDQISTKIAYLLTTNLRSSKFTNAMKFDVPAINRKIVFDLWAQKDDPSLTLSASFIEKYQYQPFEQMILKFNGFAADDLFQLEEELMKNGGEVWAENKNKKADYIVMPNNQPKPETMTIEELEKIVMEEWFWSCIQVNLS